MRCLALPTALTLIFALACSGTDTPADSGIPDDTGAGPVDTGTNEDTGTPVDTGVPVDTGMMDGAVEDTGADDAGMMNLTPELAPGSHVQVPEARLDIGDTFDAVNNKLANAARVRTPTANTRSYEYTLADSTVITIWFANTNLDDDDTVDVDGTDQVLWIAVPDGFAGETPEGISTGSTRAELEAAYGAPPHEVPLTTPPGMLGQYYVRGFLAAFDPNDDVRTITISRAYTTEPSGTIDYEDAEVVLPVGTVTGFIDLANQGTRISNVRTLLGEPDAEGDITVSGQTLTTLSYGFIGLEVFYVEGGSRTAFITVHTPFYGGFDGLETQGIGMSRAETDVILEGAGYTAATSSNSQFICYEDGNMPDVGVTFGMDGFVSSITVPLLACP